MSSVVNKSGTRFAPKVRQRRIVSATPATTPQQKAKVVSAPPESAIEDEDDEELSKEKPKQKSPVDEDDPLSHTQMAKEISISQTSTQLPVPVIIPAGQRRRSSRLDSLSNGKPLFKTGFLDPQNAISGAPDQARNRRLSTISNTSFKKKKMSSISENDTSFQAIKRRRMSSRSSTSRKSGSAQRISIMSHMNTSDSQIMTATAGPDPNMKRESADELFQRTDSLYEKYTISNLKEIPRNIADQDSSRYMVDEDSFTMADLCKPHLPIGELSDNFQRAKDATKAKMEKRKKRREMRTRAREQFKPLNILTKEEEEKLKEERKKAAENILNVELPEYEQKPHTAIQLKMNQDGSFVVDEESTVVDRHKNAGLENVHKERLDENPFENLYNSASYGRQQYTDPWTSDEMIKFYKALSMWGTDFNLIAQLFPYRSRRQVKAKFVNEERKRPVIIELALRSKLPPNFDHYCDEIKKDIGTVDEFNKKLEQLQVEHEEHLKQIEVSKQNAKQEDLQVQKAKEQDNTHKKTSGGLRHDQLKAYRKTEIVLGTIDDLKKKKAEELETGVE